jgi:hypothetical protein
MKPITGFTLEEYLTVFNAFIMGNVTSIFFSNWSLWIQNRSKIIFYPRHTLFSILVFVLTVDYWWTTYLRVHLTTAREYLFFLSLADLVIFYILSIDLFPKVDQGPVNLKDYFRRKERMLYTLFGINFLVGIVVSLITGENSLLEPESYFRMIAFLLCLSAVLTNRIWIYNFLLGTGILLLIGHIAWEGDPPSYSSTSGFSFAEYLTVYLSFFYGFVAYLFLTGWAFIFQHIQKIRSGREYFAWTLLGFALLIDAWWGDWTEEPYLAKHMGYFLLALPTPVIFYMLATSMFPLIRTNEDLDLADHFRMNEHMIYLLFGLLFISNLILGIFQKGLLWTDRENYFRAAAIVMSVTAYASHSVTLHRIILVVAWITFGIHLYHH